jgi:hypothetical protein
MAISTVLIHDLMPAAAGTKSWFEGARATSATALGNDQQPRGY